MYEEISGCNEVLIPTSDDKISIVVSKNPIEKEINKILKFIDEFNNLSIQEIKEKLKKIIPEFEYYT